MPKSKSNLKIKPGSISEGDDAMELASGEDSGDLTAEDEKKDKDILGEIKNFLSNLQTISLTDKIFFVQNLRVMVKSGLSLSLAIETIASQLTNSRFKKILTEISDRVQAGVSFAATLEKYPKVFNELFRNMVKSGELSGNLEEVLEKLHIQMKKDHDLVAKVKGAMIYPMVVLIAMVGIGAAMMIFVVPKLITILAFYTISNGA